MDTKTWRVSHPVKFWWTSDRSLFSEILLIHLSRHPPHHQLMVLTFKFSPIFEECRKIIQIQPNIIEKNWLHQNCWECFLWHYENCSQFNFCPNFVFFRLFMFIGRFIISLRWSHLPSIYFKDDSPIIRTDMKAIRTILLWTFLFGNYQKILWGHPSGAPEVSKMWHLKKSGQINCRVCILHFKTL